MNKHCHILLVDDDIASNYLTLILLEEMQVTNQISLTTTGKEAIELIEEHCGDMREADDNNPCPDVILLDLRMPVMDGFEFLDKFQSLSLPKKVSIYVLSSSSSFKDMERVRRYQVAGYLEKPLTQQTMERVLQQAC